MFLSLLAAFVVGSLLSGYWVMMRANKLSQEQKQIAQMNSDQDISDLLAVIGNELGSYIQKKDMPGFLSCAREIVYFSEDIKGWSEEEQQAAYRELVVEYPYYTSFRPISSRTLSLLSFEHQIASIPLEEIKKRYIDLNHFILLNNILHPSAPLSTIVSAPLVQQLHQDLDE